MTDFFADDAAAHAVLQLPPPSPGAAEDREEPVAAQEAAQPRGEGSADEPPEEDVPEFDPRHKQAFEGLLWVGHLRETFVLFGHSFEIATPTTTERLEMGPLLEPYQNTLTGQVAYQSALVAAYLVKVDDHELPQPIGPRDTGLLGRFNWVRDNLRRPVIEKLFDRVLVLEGKVEGVLEAMGKASG